jgi:hypothetical protein
MLNPFEALAIEQQRYTGIERVECAQVSERIDAPGILAIEEGIPVLVYLDRLAEKSGTLH